ncbi:hypothetical protein I316_06630 [Kwoniella heveanensis BCC8398]|uniref:Uncharacterized protein n=1 Tax=Kwoniella heveanensis BCC8398 TaxID=1296120 RepID=A0A1B9GL10_9TREE|nr:hypothetical protein I316_06630 [Kwoniella heveanensis BCC8398]
MSPPPPSIPLPHALLQAEQDAHLVQQRTAQRRREMKRSVLRTLTMTQNTSAMVFSVFMVAHLASPVVAVFGGLSGADKTMDWAWGLISNWDQARSEWTGQRERGKGRGSERT